MIQTIAQLLLRKPGYIPKKYQNQKIFKKPLTIIENRPRPDLCCQNQATNNEAGFVYQGHFLEVESKPLDSLKRQHLRRHF